MRSQAEPAEEKAKTDLQTEQAAPAETRLLPGFELD